MVAAKSRPVKFMTSKVTTSIVDYLVQSRDAVQAAIDDGAFLATAGAIVDRLVTAAAAGRKVLFAGNGGSAGDAQHLAGDSPVCGRELGRFLRSQRVRDRF